MTNLVIMGRSDMIIYLGFLLLVAQQYICSPFFIQSGLDSSLYLTYEPSSPNNPGRIVPRKRTLNNQHGLSCQLWQRDANGTSSVKDSTKYIYADEWLAARVGNNSIGMKPFFSNDNTIRIVSNDGSIQYLTMINDTLSFQPFIVSSSGRQTWKLIQFPDADTISNSFMISSWSNPELVLSLPNTFSQSLESNASYSIGDPKYNIMALPRSNSRDSWKCQYWIMDKSHKKDNSKYNITSLINVCYPNLAIAVANSSSSGSSPSLMVFDASWKNDQDIQTSWIYDPNTFMDSERGGTFLSRNDDTRFPKSDCWVETDVQSPCCQLKYGYDSCQSGRVPTYYSALLPITLVPSHQDEDRISLSQTSVLVSSQYVTILMPNDKWIFEPYRDISSSQINMQYGTPNSLSKSFYIADARVNHSVLTIEDSVNIGSFAYMAYKQPGNLNQLWMYDSIDQIFYSVASQFKFVLSMDSDSRQLVLSNHTYGVRERWTFVPDVWNGHAGTIMSPYTGLYLKRKHSNSSVIDDSKVHCNCNEIVAENVPEQYGSQWNSGDIGYKKCSWKLVPYDSNEQSYINSIHFNK